jgi:Mrp family chromosome partitioning ATPase
MHVIVILSGKGGVGKSTIAVQLAVGLYTKGYKVGLLDVDLCGPSIPHMLGLKGQTIHMSSQGWIPVYADTDMRLAVMSIGFLLDHTDDAVIWRGPKKTAMIGQFLKDVWWGELDYLIIDTPPGTSDEHLAVMEQLKQHQFLYGAILVTTPQVFNFYFYYYFLLLFFIFCLEYINSRCSKRMDLLQKVESSCDWDC